MLVSPSTSGQANRSAVMRAGQLEARGIEPGRRGRAEIDRLGARLPGAVHHRVADAAEPGIPRLDRRERERGATAASIALPPASSTATPASAAALRLRHHHAAPARAAGFARCQFWVMWGAGVKSMRGG